jgi:serine/threonine-protein kinase
MGQSIDSGTSVDKGTTITVTLSKGSETVEVPNVTTGSMTQEAAEAALKNAGLNVSVSSEYNSAASGIVFWQSQSAGSSVKKGTAVDIKVSLGPKPVETPAETPAETQADPASENNE